jgi:hypothetical protein
METIVFESEIKNNMIEIPDKYRTRLHSPVIVTIITAAPKETGKSAPLIIPRQSSGPKVLSHPNIDTRDWIFNREEANER